MSRIATHFNYLLFILIIISGSSGSPVIACETPFQAGDIIFHTSRSAQSKAVQLATKSQYSHMGIILYQHNRPYVFEAVAKVTYTPLNTWIQRGEKKHYVLKRLLTPLTAEQIASLHTQTKRFIGKPYDLQFLWSDKAMYCSELVWKLYHQALGIEIGQRQRMADFALNSKEVQKKIAERYGNKLPKDELVISPQAMFDSPLLYTVYRGNNVNCPHN